MAATPLPLRSVPMTTRLRPKKVLMTGDTVGGVWTYALELIQGLGRHGIQVTLATMGAPLNREQWDAVEQIPNVQVFESSFKLEWMQDPWNEVALAGQWLLGLQERVQPDLVHLNGYVHGTLPWRAPVIVVGHSCVLSWWMAVRGEPAPELWGTYRVKVTRGLHAADAVIAPSKAMASTLNQNYGPLNVRVIPNGRNPELFRPGSKEPFVLAVGRLWDEAKNIGALERIALGLTWPVVVAGDDKHPDGGIAEPKNVRYLGVLPVPALSGWFERASIYALPARYEPFGLSVLEAALAGCALVLGDIPSLRETWEDAAVFVSPNDSVSLRDAIEELIEDGERREALATCARARALQFTPERMAAAYYGAYCELMSLKTLAIRN